MYIIRLNLLDSPIGRGILLCIIILQINCTKLVEVNSPVTSINTANVYNNDATAISVLTGIYTQMSQNNLADGGITSISLFPALSADELTLYNGVSNSTYIGYYRNALSSSNPSSTAFYWNSFYPVIYLTNSAISGITGSTGLSEKVKQQLLGEAKFIRAFCYFYLVNFYGDVPLVLTTDYTVNSVIARAPKDKVWKQIVHDLQDAKALLSGKYLDGTLFNSTSERIRPTNWAAAALLARTSLYTSDWVNAEAMATDVIDNTTTFSLESLNDVFLRESREAIWQLKPVNVGENTQDGRLFIIPSTGPSDIVNPVYLSKDLLNSFEVNDLRRKDWVDSIKTGNVTYYFPFKYKVGDFSTDVTEYLILFRLAEQYLIRAEARTRQGNLTGAATDLNIVRHRAGLENTHANTQADLLTAIQKERKVELFTEWGHRWLDLKRTNTVDAVMNTVAPQKGGTWSPTDTLYPIPLSELDRNPKLVQNAGY